VLVEHLNSSPSAAFTTKGRGATKLLDFLRGAFQEQVTAQDLEELYKVHVVREKGEGSKNSFLKTKSEVTILHLWCFSPGFSMRRLAKLGPRSILVTSGTLSPLPATAEELGIPFPVQLENRHVVGRSQVWCAVLAAGMDNTPLNSSFKTRSDPKYLNSLGQTVINLIKLVPRGVLVFFPSYSLLNSTREFWQQCGVWGRIDQLKRVLVEPQRKEALPGVMADYYQAVAAGGACFMAVCRGKVAEGLDFADDNGRAVLVTGLPYPPFKDARVELKRQFLDDQRKTRPEGLSGARWYQLEAFRATNQAVGRVIRHSRDHGAVIFLDHRFGDHAARSSLSKWLQPFFQKFAHPGPAVQAIATFFKTDSAVGQERRAVVAEHAAAVAASRPAKRPLAEVQPCRQEAAPSAPEAAMYRAPAPATTARASDIYSTSSTAIGFATVAPAAPCCSSSQAPAPKRKRIKLINPLAFPSSAEVEEGQAAAGRPTNSSLAEYVSGLKQVLRKEGLQRFAAAMKEYKVKSEFRLLEEVLENLILDKAREHPALLTNFRAFVKETHRKEFDVFCEKHSVL